jgi:hypothetical protein
MKLFYRLMIWLMETEYVIGRSSGMNPHHLSALRIDISRWQAALHRMEVRS